LVYLYSFTGIALFVSIIASRKKTVASLKVAFKKFMKIIPSFITMLVFVSIILYLLPDHVISKLLGGNNVIEGTIISSIIGSLTIIPGFIAFPLAGILLEKGIAYMVLSAFTTTLMMVGIVTFPVESKYFGVKLTIIRNIVSFIIAIIIAIVIGIFYGEIII